MKITKTLPALPVEEPRAPALTKKQAMLDTTERARFPELAADFIALAAVKEKLAGKAPMPVVLKPHSQVHGVAEVAQPTHVFAGDPVRDQPP